MAGLPDDLNGDLHDDLDGDLWPEIICLGGLIWYRRTDFPQRLEVWGLPVHILGVRAALGPNEKKGLSA